MLAREVAQSKRQPQGRKGVPPPPCRIVERRVAIEPVGPQVQLLNEPHVTQRHVEVLRLSCQPAHLRQDRAAHEHGVAHLAVHRHRLERGAALVEPEIGRGAGEVEVSPIPGARVELAEHEVPGLVTAGGVLEALLRARQVRLDDVFDVGRLTQPQPPDHRHRGDIHDLRQIVSVPNRQLPRDLLRRAGQPLLDLPAGRRRSRELFRVEPSQQSVQESGPRLDPARRHRPGLRRRRAGQRVHQSLVRPDDRHQIGSVHPDPAPEVMGRGVGAVSLAFRRKTGDRRAVRVGQRNRRYGEAVHPAEADDRLPYQPGRFHRAVDPPDHEDAYLPGPVVEVVGRDERLDRLSRPGEADGHGNDLRGEHCDQCHCRQHQCYPRELSTIITHRTPSRVC